MAQAEVRFVKDPREFGLRLHMLRYSRGWNLKEMASHCGGSASMWSRYERGLDWPDAEILTAVASVFNESLDSLLADDWPTRVSTNGVLQTAVA